MSLQVLKLQPTEGPSLCNSGTYATASPDMASAAVKLFQVSCRGFQIHWTFSKARQDLMFAGGLRA